VKNCFIYKMDVKQHNHGKGMLAGLQWFTSFRVPFPVAARRASLSC
jgi:hypothetical protein